MKNKSIEGSLFLFLWGIVLSDLYWALKAKEQMKSLGVKQEDLLEVFEVTTRGAVGHYFTGRSDITIRQLKRLSEFLGVYLEYSDDKVNEETLYQTQHEKLLGCLKKLDRAGIISCSIDIEKVHALIKIELTE
ncbi:helix-turn-helix domain-containing protein [Pseudoalteromonas tunicata]|uniref:HTH cro/C1-type domain-containing protein n=1 Tax=Pseudoalteromonas tunicata D2 TaxID=87626 RepID=A4C8Q6_9GAMM|nr:helix-turn-helix transcriptional regulator [Pseudoalteromonas tunicata]AXT32514.1 XRE family transcriptional regulator [Pseudoalteromonas tunicata]EAR28971.1 hypothetical protein PTD2_08004 [Pseudoalteromonas tunicata D2]